MNLKNFLVMATFAILASCASDISLTKGMTKFDVQAKLGKPLKEVKASDGSSAWEVNVTREESVSSSYDNSSGIPGESSYERQQREEHGISSAAQVATISHTTTKWLDFDNSGKLTRSYADSFVKSR